MEWGGVFILFYFILFLLCSYWIGLLAARYRSLSSLLDV